MMTVHWKDVTTSTNADARVGKPGEVFAADYQTAGRGRLDHRWLAARGENLMFSAVLDVGDRSPEDVATLPLVVGLAVAKAISDARDILPDPKSLKVKWPNDLLYGGRKLAGILCERFDGGVIAGVGINVNQRTFPAEIAARTTSLALLAGRTLDRKAILSCILGSLESCHARWLEAGFTALYAELSPLDALRGLTLAVRQTDDDPHPVTGMCGGIQADGALLVAGTRVYAGEPVHLAFKTP